MMTWCRKITTLCIMGLANDRRRYIVTVICFHKCDFIFIIQSISEENNLKSHNFNTMFISMSWALSSTDTQVICLILLSNVLDSKVHGANMGPTWVLSAPDGPHAGPMNLAIRGIASHSDDHSSTHHSVAIDTRLRCMTWKLPIILTHWLMCVFSWDFVFTSRTWSSGHGK